MQELLCLGGAVGRGCEACQLMTAHGVRCRVSAGCLMRALHCLQVANSLCHRFVPCAVFAFCSDGRLKP